MAAKLKCFYCGFMLNEEGEEGDMKEAEGEYRVYDSLWNSKHEAGTFRLIECLKCGHIEEM